MDEIAKDLLILGATMTLGGMAGLAVGLAGAMESGASSSITGACTLIGMCVGSVAAQLVRGRQMK